MLFMFGVLILGFFVGAGFPTPVANTFDIGGIVGFLTFPTNTVEVRNISSLSLLARLSWSPLDELSFYAFSGVMNLSPVSKVPTLSGFGLGTKLSLLSKERDVNINADAQFMWLPFTPNTSSDLFNVVFFKITPNISFKAGHSWVYVGVGWTDFVLKVRTQGWSADIRPPAGFQSRLFAVVGIDYYLNPQTYLVAEMHAFGESAIFGGISHRF